MKLKKKHFKRLQEIAKKLNHELNYSGLLLSDLITDIGAVQKVKPPHEFKTFQEKPLTGTAAFLEVCANYQEEFYANYLKQGEAMVAASTDESTTTKGIRDSLKALVKDDVVVFMENYDTEPKIGDVGFFWGEPLTFVYYGRLIDIITKNGVEYVTNTGTYSNFSKTPPELK
jgi:hypothetical protein